MKLLQSLTLIVLIISNPVWAVAPISNDNGVAIRGYDPVAYFTLGKATKGNSTFTYQWMGANWWFSNKSHREAFGMNPERYAPQYGGYCAYAVSKGSTAPGDPEAWTLHHDKLYLNFSLAVKEQWLPDITGNIDRANKLWPGIKAR